jgi:plastocyanin
MARRIHPLRTVLLGTLALMLPAHWSGAVEPGVDIAAPRVAISTVGSGFTFNPARLVVEQQDHVRWMPTVAASHTTTSGANCTASGLWNASLTTVGVNFTRQFVEAPQTLPYFCSPHCFSFNMVGQVVVTTLIDVRATDTAGMTNLFWTGGGGSYRVFRSDTPAFIAGPGTLTFSPNGGSTGTTFTDTSAMQPNSGRAFFYLAMNLF